MTKEYYVKWRERSYRHCSWVPLADLLTAAQNNVGLKNRLQKYQRSKSSMGAADQEVTSVLA